MNSLFCFALLTAFALPTKPSLSQPMRFHTFILPTLSPILLAGNGGAAVWYLAAGRTRLYSLSSDSDSKTECLSFTVPTGPFLPSFSLLSCLLLPAYQHTSVFNMEWQRTKAFTFISLSLCSYLPVFKPTYSYENVRQTQHACWHSSFAPAHLMSLTRLIHHLH